jgi:hypothetical protein
VGDRLQSTSGHTVLELRADGALAASTDGDVWWTSGSAGTDTAVAEMQVDGNLVIYPSPTQVAAPYAKWSSGTVGHPDAHLVVDERGSLGRIAVIGETSSEVYFERLQPSGPSPTHHTTSTGTAVEPVAIPDVSGKSVDEAQGILTGDPYRFLVAEEHRPDAVVAKDVVIETRPAAGEDGTPGQTTVTVVVSDGSTVVVPNVVGDLEADAVAQLRYFKVSRTVVPVPAGDPRDGRVVSQTLGAGSKVPLNSPITINVARAATPTTTAHLGPPST